MNIASDLDWMDEDENLESNFKSLEQKHHLHGFREGVVAGQSHILQSAFNQGFTVSAKYYDELSRLRGCLSSLLMFVMSINCCSVEVLGQLEKLISHIEELENESCHLKVLEDIYAHIFKTNNYTDAVAKQPREEIQVDDVDTITQSFDNMHSKSDMLNNTIEKTGPDSESLPDIEIDRCNERSRLEKDKEQMFIGNKRIPTNPYLNQELYKQKDRTNEIPSNQTPQNESNSKLDDVVTRFLTERINNLLALSSNILSDVQKSCDSVTREKIAAVFDGFKRKIEINF